MYNQKHRARTEREIIAVLIAILYIFHLFTAGSVNKKSPRLSHMKGIVFELYMKRPFGRTVKAMANVTFKTKKHFCFSFVFKD